MQQAAEKLVKGALVQHGVRYTRTHNIETLRALLPDTVAWKSEAGWLDVLTVYYATSLRYPAPDGGMPEQPDAVQIERQVARVSALIEAMIEANTLENTGADTDIE